MGVNKAVQQGVATATGQIVTGDGYYYGMVFLGNSGPNSSIEVYDGTSTSGKLLDVGFATTASNGIYRAVRTDYNVPRIFSTGLYTSVVAGNTGLTASLFYTLNTIT